MMMDTIVAVGEWVWAHPVEIAAIWGALVTVASIVTKLTPTPKDDAILAKVLSAVASVSIRGRRPPG